MKLLKLALEKQNYNLAAHLLVYGLVKTQVDLYPGVSTNLPRPQKYYGKNSNKRQQRKE